MLRYEFGGMMNTIRPFERQLLKALCEASTQPTVAEGVLALPSSEKAILANVVEVALLCFRNRGGKPETEKNPKDSEEQVTAPSAPQPKTPTNTSPIGSLATGACNIDDILAGILRKLGIQSPLPPEKSTPVKTAQEFEKNLGIGSNAMPQNTRPEVEHERVLPIEQKEERITRDQKFRTNVRKRPTERCAITGEQDGIECAHILPHTLLSRPAKFNKARSAFWILLALLVGEETRNDVYSLVGENPDIPENGLAPGN